ncbi:unnamed protein product [Brassica rapa subsp. narinosa]
MKLKRRELVYLFRVVYTRYHCSLHNCTHVNVNMVNI